MSLRNWFARTFHWSTPQRPKAQGFNTFILEPILTPSGLVDSPGDDTPDIDWVGDVDIPEITDSSDSDSALDDTLDTTPTEIPDAPLDDEAEIIPFFGDEPLTPQFDKGVFTVGDSGKVGIDFLYDGGGYKGQLAIFSLEGMEDLDTEDFIAEAARRAASNSTEGYIVIDDASEGAKFSGKTAWEGDFNSGDYKQVKTFDMNAGDTFGIMLVPRGTVEQVANNPGIEGATRPLFSLSTINPEDAFHVGQIADVTGDGNTFVMEDLRVDGWTDQDYNDIIFQVRGATAEAVDLDEVIDADRDWRPSDMGQALIEYAKAYVNDVDVDGDTAVELATVPKAKQPLVGIIDTGFSSNNPDLNYDNILLGKDWVDGDDNPLLSEGEGNEHGTHIAGIIAAQEDNGIGIDGINDDAPLWVGRAVGSGKWAESLVEFVDTAKESGQPNAVVNLSMDLTQIDAEGNVSTRYEFTPAERAAIEYARQNNVLIVAAAGNDGGVMSVLGQASQEFDNIITVGAAEQFDPSTSAWQGADRTDYSSYGYGLDLMAYGGTIENPELSLTKDGVGEMAGTSVATAKVTGAVSQVWAANPELSYRQVVEILKDTATDLGETDFDRETGAGLLNMAAAIHLAKATKPEVHYAPSSMIPATWSGEGIFTPSERAVNFIYPIKEEPFDGTVAPIPAPLNGVSYRRSPRLDDRWGQYIAAVSNSYLTFDAWTYGERVTDWWLDTPDELWYRVTGTDYWVPSAYIYGYPDSSPPVLKPNTPSPSIPAPTNPSLANPILSKVDASYFSSRSEFYTTGNIFHISGWGSNLLGGGWNARNNNGYGTEGNCTWYAHGRVLELGGSRAALQTMSGNASQWHTQMSNGTQIVSSPQPGDIAQWSNNGNHVAVVEKVNPDGTIVISEAHWKTNWDGGGIGTLHNVRTISASSPDRFLRVPGVQVQDGTPASSAGTFTGRIISTIGANVRSGPSTSYSVVGYRDYGATVTFDAATTGEFISYPGLGTATDQWYRIAGTDQWISAAIVNGSPGASLNAPVARPGEQQQYIIKPGDTLWEIAQRYLGSGYRWVEIQKPDGSTFTSDEARRLQPGQSVYLPVIGGPNPHPEQPQNDIERPGPDDETDNLPVAFNEWTGNAAFSYKNESLWGLNNALDGEWADYFTLIDEKFDLLGAKHEIKLEAGFAAMASAGGFDSDITSMFKITYPESAKPGETVTLTLEPKVKGGSLSTRLGFDFNMGAKFEYKNSWGIFPDIEVGNNAFGILKQEVEKWENRKQDQQKEDEQKNSDGLSKAINALGNALTLNLKDQGDFTGTQIMIDDARLDLTGFAPNFFELIPAYQAAKNMGVNLELVPAPSVDQKTELKIQGFILDVNGQEIQSIDANNGGKFDITIPNHINPGESHQLDINIRPNIDVTTTFGMGLAVKYGVGLEFKIPFTNLEREIFSVGNTWHWHPDFAEFPFYTNTDAFKNADESPIDLTELSIAII